MDAGGVDAEGESVGAAQYGASVVWALTVLSYPPRSRPSSRGLDRGGVLLPIGLALFVRSASGPCQGLEVDAPDLPAVRVRRHRWGNRPSGARLLVPHKLEQVGAPVLMTAGEPKVLDRSQPVRGPVVG